MFGYENSEPYFQKWFKENFPSLALEDWRNEKAILPQDRKLEIKKWKKEGISSPPDFKVHTIDEIKYLCWIDVKWTQLPIKNPYSLNWNKYRNYVSVGEKTHLPVYIVLFTGKPCEDKPRNWGYVDPNKDEKIYLSDIKTFADEITRIKSIPFWRL